MRTLSTLLLLFSVSAYAQATSTTTAPQAPPLTVEQIEKLRAEVRAGKSDLIAKNVSLTSMRPRSSGRPTSSTTLPQRP